MTRGIIRLLAAVLAAGCISGARADSVRLDFRTPRNISPGDHWVMEGLTCEASEFGVVQGTVGGLYLLDSAAVTIDLRLLDGFRSAEVTVRPRSYVGGTYAYLMNRAAPLVAVCNEQITQAETWVLEAGDLGIERLRVGSFDASLLEVTLRYGTVPVAPETWGRVKALYR